MLKMIFGGEMKRSFARQKSYVKFSTINLEADGLKEVDKLFSPIFAVQTALLHEMTN
jgi:hypothetical protein